RLSTTPTPRASDRIGISATLGCSAVFSGDPFGRTAASRADAGAARNDTADDDSDNVDGSSTAPQATPSARTRALAIRRSNAARAIFPANPMRPWRSPGA
ncbi:hypothetical protein ACQCS9_25130, partial [Ralstonia pseudosolanacearum]